MPLSITAMRDEYDFSKDERDRFYNLTPLNQLPVYLDTEVFDYFAQKAKRKGIEVNTLINELLKKDIDIIEGIN